MGDVAVIAQEGKTDTFHVQLVVSYPSLMAEVTTAVPIKELIGVNVAWLTVELLTTDITDEATVCPLTCQAKVIGSLSLSVAVALIDNEAGIATTPVFAFGV